MELVLKKTLLSEKIKTNSIFLGLLSYTVLLLVFFADNQGLAANGYLVYEKGLYWKAFTTSLMHADFVHLGHNSLFFLAFSVLLNSYFGSWIFPSLCFIVGGVINLIALKAYPPQVYLVGVSGIIYFMAAFWMTLFVCLERHMPISKRLIIATGVSLVLFFPEVFVKNVSYLAHSLGFGLGILLGWPYFKLNTNHLRAHEVWTEPKPRNIDLENYIDSLETGYSLEERN